MFKFRENNAFLCLIREKGKIWAGCDKDYGRQLLFSSARVAQDVAEVLPFPCCKHVTIVGDFF